MTRDMWHMTGGGSQPSLKISAPQQLLRFGSEGDLKIGRKRVMDSLNELISDKGV